MQNSVMQAFETEHCLLNRTVPSFRPGDTLRVNYRVEDTTKNAKGAIEKKFRIQSFEGVCLRYKKGTMDASFTIRKISANMVGVERTFPLHSSHLESIELLTGGRVKRARLYFLRDLSGKAARIRSRRLPADTVLTSSPLAGAGEGIEKGPREPKKAAAKKPAKKK